MGPNQGGQRRQARKLRAGGANAGQGDSGVTDTPSKRWQSRCAGRTTKRSRASEAQHELSKHNESAQKTPGWRQ